MLSENLWLEVYDTNASRWTPLCPFTATTHTPEEISLYLRERGILFVLAWQTLGHAQLACLREVGTHYVTEKDLIRYMKAKTGCVLTETVEEYIERYAKYVRRYAEERVREAVKQEDLEIRQREMRYIPANINEFRASKYYIVPSMMKKY